MTKKERYGFSSLFTVRQSKLDKARKYGYLSAGIHFAPYDMSGHQVCPMASKGCAAACLTFSGHGGIGLDSDNMNDCQRARIARTKLFFDDKKTFWELFHREMGSFIRKAKKEGLKPTFRPNLTSDITWETKKEWAYRYGQTMFEVYPEVQFMDYTAMFFRFGDWRERKVPSNYHLTFSLKEDNEDLARAVLAQGYNVAGVLRVGKGEPFPATYWGVPVIDGDEHDLRFLDKKGCFVALRPKGVKGMRDTSGFVRDVI